MTPTTAAVPDLDPARWQRVRDLLDEAREQPADTRAAWLAAACDDADLRTEVEALLAASEAVAAGGFLAGPAADGAAALFDGEADPYVGRVVGPWRLAERIGEGGMGVVYRAERADGAFAQTAALKLVAHGLAPTARVERFRRERQILAGLEHPGVARLLGGGVTDDGQPYFAMELVAGAPITAYADARGLGVEARLRLVLDVCAAVAYAHRNLVVHRDLKPSNVVVATGDRGAPDVKLLDFGIAKLLSDDADAATATRTGPFLTPAYAAPEQVRGEAVTTATDVYSLGVLLFELLTGRRPYDVEDGATMGAIERTVCETVPAAPSAVAPASRARALRGDLDTITLKALEKEPDRRYPSAEALADDLRRHLDGLPITARRATRAYRLRSFVRRYPVGVGLSALAVLALVLGLAGTTWQARVAAAERDRARHEAETSRQVTDLLTGLFVEADPYLARGEPLTVREMLERGPARVAAQLEDQPDVQAELLQAIGQTFLHLGRYAQADSVLRRALALHERVGGRGNARTADARKSLAHARYYAGDFAEAERLYREALAAFHAVGAPADPNVPYTLRSLALTLIADGRAAEADPLLREALALARRTLGVDHPHIGLFLTALGDVLRAQGRLDEAEPYSRQAIAHYERVDPGGPDLYYALAYLARLQHERGDDAEAAALYRRALSLQAARAVPDDPVTANYRTRLAISLMALGEEAEAEALLLAAVASLEALGDEHRYMQGALEGLVRLYEARGQPRRAASYRRRLAALA